MPGYKIIDVRGRFAEPDGSWGAQPPDLGVILHYAGTDVAEGWWNSPLAYIKHIINLHSQRGRFAAGWTFSGSAYTEYAFGDTIYRVMNLRAWTPHAGNLAYNKRAVSVHIPVGLNQLPSHVGSGTMLTALRRAGDHLRAQSLSRQWLKGHREVGSSLCPGEPIMESIRNYRQGADVQPPKADNPPVQSAPSGTVFRVIAGAFGERSNAQTRANQIKAKGFGEPWIYRHGNFHTVQVASFSDPVAADEMVVRLKAAKFDAYALAEKA